MFDGRFCVNSNWWQFHACRKSEIENLSFQFPLFFFFFAKGSNSVLITSEKLFEKSIYKTLSDVSPALSVCPSQTTRGGGGTAVLMGCCAPMCTRQFQSPSVFQWGLRGRQPGNYTAPSTSQEKAHRYTKKTTHLRMQIVRTPPLRTNAG